MLNIAQIPLVTDKNIENECYCSDNEDLLTEEYLQQKQSIGDKLDNENNFNVTKQNLVLFLINIFFIVFNIYHDQN